MTLEIVEVSDVLVRSDAGVWGKDAEADGISILRSTNFRADGELSFENLAIKSVEPRDRERKLLLPGDILVEKSGGGPKQPVGRVCFFRGDHRPHVFGNFIARLRAEPARCDPRFLFWFLHISYQNGSTENFQKQTTGIRNLDFQRFLGQQIALPSLKEQRRFAELLDRAAEIRGRAEAARAKARAIIPALFLDTFGDPATNPKGWPEVHLSVLLLSPLSYGSMTSPKADEAGWRDIRVANIRGGLIDHTDTKYVELEAALRRKHTLRDGDIVLARAIGSEQHLGKCALVFPGTERWAYDSHIMRIRVDPERVSPFWLHALMNTDGGKKRLLRRSRASAIQHNINTKEVGAFNFALPPLDLQTAFAEQVQRIEALARNLDAAAAKAEAMAAALSAEVFEAGARRGNGDAGPEARHEIASLRSQ